MGSISSGAISSVTSDVERAVAHLQIRERVGLLHREAQPRRRACR